MGISWIILSLIAFLSFSVMSTLIVFLTKQGQPLSLILFGVGLTLAIFYFVQTFVLSNNKINIDSPTLLLIGAVGILSAIANLSVYFAAASAPNPGLAIAIGGMQALGVTILSFIFFKNSLTPFQLIGLILSIFAILFIQLGSK